MSKRILAAFGVVLCAAWQQSHANEQFVDVAAATGVDFIHFNGMSGELYYPENMGSGAALFDYDNDGDPDIYLVQGHMLGGKPVDSATFPPDSGGTMFDRLYRNDLGEAGLAFTDVTEESGIVAPGYGMGVAVGDIDNDGWLDLYVMNYANNQMFRNNGDGTFTDISESSGSDNPRWSVSASFLDYDRDGLLDLYVGNYFRHNYENRRVCHSNKLADYCGPLVGSGYKDSLFRNLGNGRFEDVSVETGITKTRWRRSHTDGSYASAGDPRILFGAGQDDGPYEIIVAWPDGVVEAWAGLEKERYHAINKGSGRAAKLPGID